MNKEKSKKVAFYYEVALDTPVYFSFTSPSAFSAFLCAFA